MCENNSIFLGFLAVLSIVIISALCGWLIGWVLERNRKPWRPKPDSFQAIDWRHRDRKERRRGDA